jgi:flagellar biosynthesis GTPase FlhF
MKKIFFILLILLTASAQADEVFKCQLKSGKTAYQSKPCDSAEKQETIEIQKTDPRKTAEEEAKLKAWEEDFAKREAERAKIEQELQAERDRKASVEALRQSAEYQRQQAYEAKRQADAMEQRPLYLQPYYPSYQSIPAFPLFQSFPTYPPGKPHYHHDFNKETFPDSQHHEQFGTRPDKDRESGSKQYIFKVR